MAPRPNTSGDRRWPPRLFADDAWQMSYGERAAIEGMLVQVRPRLAIEIGTAQGGSLTTIAAHSERVHTIDLVEPSQSPPRNVEVHAGDSHVVLPRLLERLTGEGENVDFVLVDGDHTAAGVRADIDDLLASPAIGRTLICVHDTLNPEVRAGKRSVRFSEHPKVRYVELDFIAGYMGREAPFEGQLWGGLGIVVVDAESDPEIPGGLDGDPRYHDAGEMLRRSGGSGALGALRRLLSSR